MAAAAAIVGVTGSGGVALAGPAMAAPADPASAVAQAKTTPPAGVVELPKLDPMTVGDVMGALHAAQGMAVQSPLPDGPVNFEIAHLKISMTPERAEQAQTVIANFYDALGYQTAFTKKGVLTIGKKVCDDTKSKDWNKGCVNVATDSRF
jgi:hypothetical protein